MGWAIENPSVIYAIRCKENGRLYIGRTYRLKSRIREHFAELRKGYKGEGSKRYGMNQANFQKDFNRYGEDAFELFVLQENVSPDLCQQAESKWISEYNTTDPRYGYNIRSEKLKKQLLTPTIGFPPKPWDR